MVSAAHLRASGEIARLTSPTYTPPAGEQCLEFWYHMSSIDVVGTLNVYFQTDGLRGYPKFIKAGKKTLR